MSDEKKYYWLKLNETFFEEDTIQWIEEQENGKEYVIFYLKLALKSLKDNGKLIRYVGETLIPYDTKALAKLTNTNIDTVHTAMHAFEQIGLIERLETGEIYMKQINEMVGSETQSAERMRRMRAKEKLLDNQNAHSSNNVTQERNIVTQERNNVQECYSDVQKSYIENRDRDKEIENRDKENRDKEIENRDKENKELHSDKSEHIPFKEIIDYLNEKTSSSYKSTTKATQSLIKARFNEGFDIEDFKTVIDIKTEQWLRDSKMNVYLRPQTLFGTKFESYLNEQNLKKHDPRSLDTSDMSWLDADNLFGG